MWQKCPRCDGSGKVSSQYSSVSYTLCPVCDGKQIIDDISGLPPSQGGAQLEYGDNSPHEVVIKNASCGECKYWKSLGSGNKGLCEKLLKSFGLVASCQGKTTCEADRIETRGDFGCTEFSKRKYELDTHNR